MNVKTVNNVTLRVSILFRCGTVCLAEWCATFRETVVVSKHQASFSHSQWRGVAPQRMGDLKCTATNPRHYMILSRGNFAIRHSRVQLLHCKRLTVVPSTDTATLDWLDTTSIARDLGWLSWSLKLFRLLSPSISSSPPPESSKHDLLCFALLQYSKLETKHELISFNRA